jgi:hypothetical protein
MANASAQPAPPEAQAAQHVFQLATGYIASTALQIPSTFACMPTRCTPVILL